MGDFALSGRGEFGEGKVMNDKRKRLGKEKDQVIIPAAFSLLDMPQSYTELLADIRKQIHYSRLKAVLFANATLVFFY